jgi:hypothetical protein
MSESQGFLVAADGIAASTTKSLPQARFPSSFSTLSTSDDEGSGAILVAAVVVVEVEVEVARRQRRPNLHSVVDSSVTLLVKPLLIKFLLESGI